MTEEELQIVVEQEKILAIISRLNKIFPTAQEICTQGMCIQFALLLKSIWPQGTILYDQDHAIFQYGSKAFDINGEAIITEHHMPLVEFGILEIERWIGG